MMMMILILRPDNDIILGYRGLFEIITTPQNPGVLTIYKNHPGGNFVRKYKTIKFDLVGEQTATKYIQIS